VALVNRILRASVVTFALAFGGHQALGGVGAPTLPPAVALGAPQTVAGMRGLALQYEHGEGLTQDYSRARDLYCKAASLGDPNSALDLAWMYLNGRGVARDDAKAAWWLHRAADRGISQAENLLRTLGNVTPSADRRCATDVIFSTARPPSAPVNIRTIVQDVASKMKLDPGFITAVIAAESAFDARAVSRRGAQGLMQLMPETATRFGVRDPFNPAENIRGGASYLRWLLEHFGGDVSLALAAYNAGEAAVGFYGGVPPFPETLDYVERVQRFYAYSGH